MSVVKNIKKLGIGRVISDAKMKDYTTYKVGGPVKCVVYPNDEVSLITLIKYLEE